MKRLVRSAVLFVLGPVLLFGCTSAETAATPDLEPQREQESGVIAGAQVPEGCVPVRGSNAFMPTASEVDCLLITDSQSVHVRNFSEDVITFEWLGAQIRLGAHDRVELHGGVNPAGPSGASLLSAPSVSLGAVYQVDPEQSVSDAYELDGPEVFGPVAVGMTLDEASAALAHPIVVEPNLYASEWLDNGVVINGPHVWEAYVLADPHSPAFIVAGDGSGSSEIVHIVRSTEHLADCLSDSHPEPAPCEWTDGLPFASRRGTSNEMEWLLTGSFNIDEDPPTLSVVFDRTDPIAGAEIQRCWDRALREDIGDDRVDNFVWEPDAIPAARMAVVRALFHCVEPEEIHRALVATKVDGWNLYEPTVKTVDSGHPCWTERYAESFDSFEADWLQSIHDDERPIWTQACREEFLAS